ncbi:MAG: NAD(P)-dependent oxidoreductase [Candidatus Devosia phytovorans]|uniref:NAD(P)-dependent oxidoreductase n=1 Tax=Candidatus Devosia phytovorans TaxID=3121372 RepID=A0AAJ6AYN5_9HYPH|nr:NAD(P)-dependent oxidoreductase [Devosia sp.]WEK03785.1 MAG: NAD(P)-dependent oxidoreductase [Devosia sp.]
MIFTVLGSSGFIGGALTSRLRQHGHIVRTPARNEFPSTDDNLGHVIYCIGLTADFRRLPFETVNAHVSVLASYLKRCEFESFLYLSSTRVYVGSALAREDQSLSVNPGDASDIYNLSKLMGEALVFAQHNRTSRIARLSNVVGIDLNSENFLIDVCRQALSGKISIRTSLASMKDYIHVNDVVNYLVKISTDGQSGTYNVAFGKNITHGQIVERLQILTRCSVEVASSAPTVQYPVIDVEKLRNDFGPCEHNILDSIPEILSALS